MDSLFQTPFNHQLAVLLGVIALLAALMGIHRFRKAYTLAGDYRSAIWFVRGIRCLIIALTSAAWAVGFYWQQSWLLIIGLVILAQELYEGFVLSAALRDGYRIETGQSR
jgi:multisubunit Na+/H+ antiporter MnhG subunit